MLSITGIEIRSRNGNERKKTSYSKFEWQWWLRERGRMVLKMGSVFPYVQNLAIASCYALWTFIPQTDAIAAAAVPEWVKRAPYASIGFWGSWQQKMQQKSFVFVTSADAIHMYSDVGV